MPQKYVTAERDRLQIYQRIAAAGTLTDVDELAGDLADIFGPVPSAAAVMLDLARLRLLAGAHTIRTIAIREDDLVFYLDDPEACKEVFARSAMPPRFADPKEVHLRINKRYREPRTLLRVLFKLLQDNPTAAG